MNKLLQDAFGDACSDLAVEMGQKPRQHDIDAITANVETRLVSAAWALRRMPDKEAGWLASVSATPTPPADPEEADYFKTRLSARISAKAVDDMQPALDLLLMLPDTRDRQLLFWASWHQAGELLTRIPWGPVRVSMVRHSPLNNYTARSSKSLKRYYDNSLEFLAHCIANQAVV